MARDALKIVQKFFPSVTMVVDAERGAKIEVTPLDAKSKGVKDHAECAFAQACKRQMRLDGVIISRSVAYLVKGKMARRFLLPSSVSREVVSFDRGAGFEPGEYLLSPISPARKLGRSTSESTAPRSGNGKPKKFRHLTANVRAVLGSED